MKANELMIGDWVYNTHNRQNEQVAEIGSGLVMLAYNDLYEYDEIEPIPLVPEILKKMGFKVELEPKYDDTYTKDVYLAYLKCVDARGCDVEVRYETSGNELSVFSSDRRNILPCKMVDMQVCFAHELQHIFNMLQIDKEIIL